MKPSTIKAKLLPVLFIKAKDKGISQERLREEICLEVIGCRISKASAPQILRLIDHITGGRPRNFKPRYEQSLNGLKEELKDLAAVRWGDGWENSLNAFCQAFGVSHYNFLDVTHAKAVKKRLIEMG